MTLNQNLFDFEIMKSQEKNFNRWNQVYEILIKDLLNTLPEIEDEEIPSYPKLTIASQLIKMQFNTYLSIFLLYKNFQFLDAHVLLRTLYEGDLLLWNIWKGDEEQAIRYIMLSKIHDWKIYKELSEIDGAKLDYYTENSIEEIKKSYEEALKFFNTKRGKIPGNYTTTSNKEIAQKIANEEGVFWKIIYTNLYTIGSEYVHRTSKGIDPKYI